MNIPALQTTLDSMKQQLEGCIRTSSYNGKLKANGEAAKRSLIASSTFIQQLHETVKNDFSNVLSASNIPYTIHPPLNSSFPEKNIWGFLKKKRQDVVVCYGQPSSETILNGPLSGEVDELGRAATTKSIVVGVRSQLSSVENNYDTLMERTFAETFNLRLRHPLLVMGDVYLLNVVEYDVQAMKHNRVSWKPAPVKVEKFINLFNAISHRTSPTKLNQSFKYERSALILADFSRANVKVYASKADLIADNLLSAASACDYDSISPQNFASDLVDAYQKRNSFIMRNIYRAWQLTRTAYR